MNTMILWAIGGVAALALLFGMYKGIDASGYRRGEAETTSRWQEREAKQVADYNSKRQALEDQYREREKSWTAMLTSIDTDHQKEILDAKKQRDADVAAARSGALKLRDPAGGAPCPAPGGSAPGGAATGPGVGDGRAAGELSREATEFLLGLVDEADEVVRQLTACQAVVRADRAAR